MSNIKNIVSRLHWLGGYLKEISKVPTFEVLNTLSLCTSVFQLAGSKKNSNIAIRQHTREVYQCASQKSNFEIIFERKT